MKYIDNTINALKEVYSHNSYFAVSFISAILIYSLNAVAHNYKILASQFSFSLLFSLIIGAPKAMVASSFIFLVIISIFAGILVSMSIFLLKRQIMDGVYASGTGIVVSILAPACPSCALGLLGILGIGSFLSVLPFKGLELGLLGVFIVVASLFYLSNKIMTNTCSIKAE